MENNSINVAISSRQKVTNCERTIYCDNKNSVNSHKNRLQSQACEQLKADSTVRKLQALKSEIQIAGQMQDRTTYERSIWSVVSRKRTKEGENEENIEIEQRRSGKRNDSFWGKDDEKEGVREDSARTESTISRREEI
ncbi:hypothetical protein ALC62_02401 [Cyphomyrmex costatus]|uniref:Uncharacterized protein n=1 Tax=Cyphomyrmex costatus TaxID=456900 RepID=A0A195D1J7_9HYME|nr:hypothetical protein ALC62_02401 [Cyphomyrmex costatus]